jgi:hypothetical protein
MACSSSSASGWCRCSKACVDVLGMSDTKVLARRETGFQLEPKPPWKPREWSIEPGNLYVFGDRVLAAYSERVRGGIGMCYGFDLATGARIYETAPGPYKDIAAAHDPGSFLVGLQGFGAFETKLVDPSGRVMQSWLNLGGG